MAMVEYAWCSMNDNAKMFECSSSTGGRFHPTQKPVSLYQWIYANYAEKGYKILDTHLGSGSSRIAAWESEKQLEFIGFEIDTDYYEKQEKRFKEECAQMNIWHLI